MSHPARTAHAMLAAIAVGVLTTLVAHVSGFALAAAPAGAAETTQIPADARQLIVVSSPTADPADYLTSLRAYRRSAAGAPWRPAFPGFTAETGSGHLVAAAVRREGDHATPIGVFGFGFTIYGNQPDPGGLRYPYHRLVCGDWWDEDPYSAQYNHFVHVPCGVTPAFAGGSEALWTETRPYPYFAVIRFNMDPIRRGAQAPGSGIFLHSWGGAPTQGCVALPEAQLLTILRWLRPSEHPVIWVRVGGGGTKP